MGGCPAPHLHRDPDQHLLERWEHAAGPGSVLGVGVALAAGGRDRTLSPEHRLPVVSAATRRGFASSADLRLPSATSG